jgi:hypothetical protein
MRQKKQGKYSGERYIKFEIEKVNKMAARNRSYMSVGAYNKLPHYAVVGSPTEFYVWCQQDKSTPGHMCNSEWIRGRDAFDTFHKLEKLFKKDKPQFTALLKSTFNANPKIEAKLYD